MELDQGGIYIDDVEVAKLGLAQLRNSMAIIPQVNLTSRPAPLLASPFARVAISVQAVTVCCVRHGGAILSGMMVFGVTEVQCVQGVMIGHCF